MPSENANPTKRGFHFGYLVVAAMVLTSFIPLSLGLSCAGIFYPSVSNAIAALIWGTVIDATQSYMPMFVGVIILMVLTIVCVMLIGRANKN